MVPAGGDRVLAKVGQAGGEQRAALFQMSLSQPLLHVEGAKQRTHRFPRLFGSIVGDHHATSQRPAVLLKLAQQFSSYCTEVQVLLQAVVPCVQLFLKLQQVCRCSIEGSHHRSQRS